MDEIKFCEDCRWSRVPNTGKQYTRCFHISVIVPVHRDESEVYCKIERTLDNQYIWVKCGKEGKLWEKRC